MDVRRSTSRAQPTWSSKYEIETIKQMVKTNWSTEDVKRRGIRIMLYDVPVERGNQELPESIYRKNFVVKKSKIGICCD